MGTIICSCNEPIENKNNSVNIYEDKGIVKEEIMEDKNVNMQDITKPDIREHKPIENEKFIIAKLNDNNNNNIVTSKLNDQSNIVTGVDKKRGIIAKEKKSLKDLKDKSSKKNVGTNRSNKSKKEEKSVSDSDKTSQEKKIFFTEDTFKLSNYNVNKNELKKNEIQVCITGNSEIGKTTVFYKVTKNRFESVYVPTIHNEKEVKNVPYNNQLYKLTFVDTPGRTEYQNNLEFLFDKSNFIFLLFDSSKKDSFEEMKKILFEKIGKCARLINNKICNVYIINNMPDLSVKKDQNSSCQNFCTKFNLKYFDICVKTSYGIKSLLEDVISAYSKIFEE